MREGDRRALHLWWELRTTGLLHMIHPAHSSAPCPSYCMSNHLSRRRDICDLFTHTGYGVMKFLQLAQCSTTFFFTVLQVFLLMYKKLNVWDHQHPNSLHEYSCLSSSTCDHALITQPAHLQRNISLSSLWMNGIEFIALLQSYKGNIPCIQFVFNLHFHEKTKECRIALYHPLCHQPLNGSSEDNR